MSTQDKELRENLMRDLDILHTVNHKKGERPDLYGEMNLIDKYAQAYGDERERVGEHKYDDLFAWLLGEKGDFPQSEQYKMYGWRKELRNRLAELQKGKK